MDSALKDIQSKLSTSNIAQELFSSFTARWAPNVHARSLFHTWTPPSHKAVLDVEIQFLHEQFAETYPESLMDHIQRMVTGEAPFFPATLSLVYDRLIEQGFSLQASTSNLSISPSSHSQALPTPGPVHVPLITTVEWTGLRCVRCRTVTLVNDLYGGLHCPYCDDRGRNGKGWKGKPFMRCTGCGVLRENYGNTCYDGCGLYFS